MKRKLQKSLAAIMAFAVILTTVLPEQVYAVGPRASETVSQNEVTDSISQDGLVPEEEVMIEEPIEEEIKEEAKLNFLYLEKPNLQAPDTQNIAIGFGDGTKAIVSGTLTVENYETKQQTVFDSKLALDDSVLFSMNYTKKDAGIYEAVSAEFTMEDGSKESIRFSDTGMEAVYFGVDREFSLSTEKTELKNATLDMQIVSLENNSAAPAAVAEISSAVENALDQTKKNTNAGTTSDGITLYEANQTVMASASGSNGLVVMIDPGHDASHAGARGCGLNEEELTLKIAKYCKEELEKYRDVTVYMTRESAACPFPGTSAVDDIYKRVAYAKSVGANVYVSIHLNAGVAGAQGAEVYYPNNNYNPAVGAQGAGLADDIEVKLVALGLSNRGIHTRNSTNTTYPDGSVSDYYAVISSSKRSGFPGIIIEHAFLTNTSDAAFLSNEANLKKLGIADAQGIAEYYGLELDDGTERETKAGMLTYEDIDNIKGTFTLRLTGATGEKGIKKVEISVWSKADKSNFKTYTAKKQSDGTYTVKVKISNHDYQYARYTAMAVVTDKKGKTATVKKSKNITAPKPEVTAVLGATEKYVTITASGVACSNGVDSVQIALWSKAGGKDDLAWYNATRKSASVFTSKIKIANHKSAGVYKAEIYATDKLGNRKKIAGKLFTVTGPAIGNLSFEDIDGAKGTFKLKLTDTVAVSGISKVQFRVWRDGDKANTVIYDGKKKLDGSYMATVKISRHGGKYGRYRVETIVTDKNKITATKKKSKNITAPPADLIIEPNSNMSQYTITVKGVTCPEGVKGVKIAVWSKENGKDDLVWYTAVKKASGWKTTVKLADHKGFGIYSVEVYAVSTTGKEYKVAAGSFDTGNLDDLYAIMGTSTVTVDQMVAYYKAVTDYPSYYADTEAPTIKKFCQIYLDECNAEGLKAEVAFIQAMKETNFLRYGGDVDISQYNFAGLGAIGGGVKGESYESVTIGIRAHVQHLKAYASDEPLKNACVDSRFARVARYSAPYVQWLGIGENPYGKGWATDPRYGYDIVSRIRKLKTY